MNNTKYKKLLIFVSSLTAVFSAAIPSFSTSASVYINDKVINNGSEISTTEVLSYVDVFESYYEKATNILLDNELEMTLTFDEFCDGYYSNDDDIVTYTNNVVDYVANYSNNSGLTKTTTLSASSSSPASYILKSYTDYTTTPKSAFRREPIYDTGAYDYSLLLAGDIVYETNASYSRAGVDHTAIISDISHDSYYGSYVQTIEAVSPNVSFGILDDERMVNFGVEILRVVGTTTTIRSNAITFAKTQVGKSYSLNITRLNTSIDSSGWYCSELMYASYKYAGIDITRRYTSSGKLTYQTTYCYPSHIYSSYNTYVKGIENKYFVDLQLVYGSKWKIRIHNNTGSGRYVYYNSKMAFANHAENWSTSSLSDITKVYVSSGDTETITIATNWFATSITTSVVVGSRRYVTWANGLSTDWTMNISYNRI